MADKENVRDLRTIKRDSESDRIGRIGHRQFANRLEEFGWMPGNIDPDKGEDLLVRIYEEYRFTGLNFYAQIKSTSKLQSTIDAQTGDIKFSADTKDLDHWNSSSIPVFLFVWDIETQIGYWIEISDEFLHQLDNTNQEWRSQRTVTIVIPKINQTDNDGLQQIRQIVTQRFLPLYTQNKTLTLQLKAEFPDTPEGQSMGEKMRLWHETGEPVTLTGPYIKELVASDWHERLYGPLKVTDKTAIAISSSPSEIDVPIQFTIMSLRGRIVARLNTTLRVIQRGTVEMTLTNDHHPTPFRCQVILRVENGGTRFRVNISVEGSTPNAHEAYDALDFWHGMAEGGDLVTTIATPNKPWELRTAFPKGNWPVLLEGGERVLANLVTIEKKAGVKLRFADWAMTYETDYEAQELKTILETGRITEDFDRHNFNLGGPKSPDAAKSLIDLLLDTAREKERFDGKVAIKESSYELLGVSIPLGPSHIKFQGTIAPDTIDALQQAANAPELVENLTISLINGRSVHTFQQWLPESDEFEFTIQENESSEEPEVGEAKKKE